VPPTPLPRNPLRNYQFRVAVIAVVSAGETPSGAGDLTYVAGVRSVSGLRAQVAAVETWEGGNALHRYANPGKVTWEPIALEQGLALDSTFEDWARAVLDFAATGKKPVTGPVKRQVIIDVWDENSHPDGPPSIAPPPRPSPSQISPFSANLKVDIKTQGSRYKRFHIHNAWISKYLALPKLDSMTSEVALLSVELMHEGWVESIVV
jgi:phage tail-like protein